MDIRTLFAGPREGAKADSKSWDDRLSPLCVVVMHLHGDIAEGLDREHGEGNWPKGRYAEEVAIERTAFIRGEHLEQLATVAGLPDLSSRERRAKAWDDATAEIAASTLADYIHPMAP